MFDFRYHVVSLAAVFVSLVIGILVGVGLSGRGFVDDAERRNLTDRIAGLEQALADAQGRLDAAGARRRALDDYASATYPVVVPGRLEGKRIAVLFVGSVDQSVSFAVRQAVRDAGGRIDRVRALRVPLEGEEVHRALASSPASDSLDVPFELGDVGAALARELVAGTATPVWDALADTLVEERTGGSRAPADAVVVARPADPQRGPTRQLLAALYRALARAGIPAAGIDTESRVPSAVPAFQAAGLSTVDSVTSAAGRLALVLLLAGAEPGSYGVLPTATDGILPPVDELSASTR